MRKGPFLGLSAGTRVTEQQGKPVLVTGCLLFPEIAFSAAGLVRTGEEAVPVAECLKPS